jgi:hypothetical protein
MNRSLYELIFDVRKKNKILYDIVGSYKIRYELIIRYLYDNDIINSKAVAISPGSRSSVASEEVAKSAEALFPHRREGLDAGWMVDGWRGGWMV